MERGLGGRAPTTTHSCALGSQIFRNVAYDAHLAIVLDVRELKVKNNTVTLNPLGWTVVPVFRRGVKYVDMGCYTLPLASGTPHPVQPPSTLSACDGCVYMLLIVLLG